MPGVEGAFWALAARAAAPGLRLMLKRRAAKGKEVAARLPERFGIDATPRPEGSLVWVHAASVGETVSMLPVLVALPASVFCVFTTGTVTSAELLAARLEALGLGHRVLHRFVPLDVPAWAARFLDHWQPQAACFVESELWPNILAACRKRGVPTALINARMSARSAARWRILPRFASEILQFSWVAAQSEADAARLRALGAPHVTAPGNLKFAAEDLPVDAASLAWLSTELGDRPRWLAASTHPGDEALAVRVHTALLAAFPDLLTCIVPRHPARGAEIARENLGAAKRSAGDGPPAGGVWVADTMGELGLFYRLFPIVFMGKSFGSGGGQNPLEPARLGCAVASGPATENFADAVALLTQAGGLEIVADENALQDWVAAMLSDHPRREAQAQAAAGAASQDAELPARIAGMIVGMIG